MLTQLSTVKTRLGIAPADTQYDALLTDTIVAVSAMFDRETRRELARTVNATQEFAADEYEIPVSCYPIESILKFEVKSSEAGGWSERTPEYLIRRGCVVSLDDCLGTTRELGRITYTGGYLLPNTVPEPPAAAVPLPADLIYAASEQVAAFFQNRDKVGLIRHWPNSGTYTILSQQPLLPKVTMILRRYERWMP
jgi:hypothetical protein